MLKEPLTIAITTLTLVGTTACEREKTADESIEGSKAEDTRTRIEERLDANHQRRLDAAQERLERLDRRASDARRELEARGGEARTELDADIEKAKVHAKNKLEAARKASADSARHAIDELEDALDDLDNRLRDYDRT